MCQPAESCKSLGLPPRSSRLTSTFDSATGITTTYTYEPNTNYISQETVTSNLSPVTLAVYSYSYRNDGLKVSETDTTYNPVAAQLIVKMLIFMIMGDYAVVQRLDDMESWQ